ncbi:DeoR/GlpR family DNA-binding transcription regulator [Enterococcus sp. AZ072]|uniref:DeoR/GlpR family DNA-binding transcription regulator n=1 Tax=unclassified Enterococcus TaxID=2608891 RepID=UPI003D2E298F
MLSVIEDRQQQIVNYLKVNQFARVADLIELVNYSEATVKRDLIMLEKTGLIRRTRGGAMLVDNKKIDVPFLMKVTHLDEENNKQYIANVAETLIKDDMVIFLDSSTTCLHLIKNLSKFDGLQIITNGVLTAVMLSEFTSAHVSILGGSIVPKRATINGSKAYNDSLTYNADLAFIGCRGLDFEHGVTETHEGEAQMKKAFRRQANQLIVLATSDKLDHKYMYQGIACHEIDYLITDQPITGEKIEKLANHHIKCLY